MLKIDGKYWLGKGQGGTHALLNGGNDELEFTHLFHLAHFDFVYVGGCFCLGLNNHNVLQTGQSQAEDKEAFCQPGLYLWGSIPGDSLGQMIMPKLISKLQVTQISCGWDHALFKANSSLDLRTKIYGIGSNQHNQLGSIAPQFYPNPILIDSLEENQNSSFCAGFRLSAIKNTSMLRILGALKLLGLALELKEKREIIVNCLLKIRSMCAGKKYILLLGGEQVYGIGKNESGIFGFEDRSNEGTAEQSISMRREEADKIGESIEIRKTSWTGIKKISSGWRHMGALTTSCELIVAGNNSLRQLGMDKAGILCGQSLPEGIKFSDVVCGSEWTMAIDCRGGLWGWGWNEHRNLLPVACQIVQTPSLILQFGVQFVSTHSAATVTLVDSDLFRYKFSSIIPKSPLSSKIGDTSSEYPH